MTHSERTRLVVALSAVLVVAAGCTGSDGDATPSDPSVTPSDIPVTASSTPAGSATPDGSPAPGTSAADSASSAGTPGDGELGTVTPPPFPADTREDTEAAVGAGLVFTDLRIGRQDGFDRVVWEFAGDGEPGWLARYEATPARDGSGEPVDLPGDATLLVLIEGVTIAEFLPTPDPGITPYPGNGTAAAADTQHVTEVIAGGWFEGYQDGFVGVDSERPFRVYRLADPPRVVLEVSD